VRDFVCRPRRRFLLRIIRLNYIFHIRTHTRPSSSFLSFTFSIHSDLDHFHLKFKFSRLKSTMCGCDNTARRGCIRLMRKFIVACEKIEALCAQADLIHSSTLIASLKQKERWSFRFMYTRYIETLLTDFNGKIRKIPSASYLQRTFFLSGIFLWMWLSVLIWDYGAMKDMALLQCDTRQISTTLRESSNFT